MNRLQGDVKTEEIIAILDNKAITIIENILANAEWKSLGATLIGAYLIPFLRRILKSLEKRHKKLQTDQRTKQTN